MACLRLDWVSVQNDRDTDFRSTSQVHKSCIYYGDSRARFPVLKLFHAMEHIAQGARL